MSHGRPVKVPKIVRDNMPEYFERYGDKATWTIISGDALKKALLEKCVEEANEVLEDPCLEEFADCFEVLRAAADAHGFTKEMIHDAMATKRAKRGGFTRGVYLTSFEWGPKT